MESRYSTVKIRRNMKNLNPLKSIRRFHILSANFNPCKIEYSISIFIESTTPVRPASRAGYNNQQSIIRKW